MRIEVNLNDIEFDHVFRVTEDGQVTDAEGYAPSVLDEEIDDAADWQFFSTGYTRQDSYSGPIMHNSELLGGALARDILDTPGVYAVVVANWSPEEDEEEYVTEGWAVLRMKDNV